MRLGLKSINRSVGLLRFPRRMIYGSMERYQGTDKNATSKDRLSSSAMGKDRNPIQFNNDILDKNGDYLPYEIPNALKYSRPFQMATLDNGIRVCTEHWPGELAAIGVIIGAGSRHETLETSGTAHFMEHLHFKVKSNNALREHQSDQESN